MPVLVFWTVQVYTVYYASFHHAGIYVLPIGFCIAVGAIMSAVLMTVLKTKIRLILVVFCIMQTAGKPPTRFYPVNSLGSSAII